MAFEIETYNQYALRETKYNLCPICSHTRTPKNQKKKCLVCDWEKGLGKCFHCGNLVQLHSFKGSTRRQYFIKPLPKKVKHPEGSYHSLEAFDEMVFKYKEFDNFTNILKCYFDKQSIYKANTDLLIFSTNDYYKNSICYPYITPDEKVTAIKVMAYDDEGKRIRNDEGQARINWMHSLLKIENWQNDICLFGLHQIKFRPEKVVHIVESEKTAYVMTIAKPDFIWLASGGLTMLNERKLKPLLNYKIVFHPDKGKAFEQWSQFAEQWSQYDIIVSRITEDNPEIPENGDLADYYLQNKNKFNIKLTEKYRYETYNSNSKRDGEKVK